MYSYYIKTLSVLLLTIAVTYSVNVFSQQPSISVLSGDEVVKRINQRDEGVSLSRYITMTMTDRRNKTRVRKTRAFRKYYGDDKHTAIFYLSPKNVKNTAFLTLDYADTSRDDDQWLYLPAMRKVRRISASDRGDYFLGTDFTFEDIKLESRTSLKDYHRETIGESDVDGFHCIIVQSTVKSAKIGRELGHHVRQDCIDSNVWIMRKSDLWDEKENHVKTIYFKDIEKIQGIWSVQKMLVENHRTKHKTVFDFSEIDYQKDIPGSLFTTSSIKRGL